jgi:hypothetical protein
VNNKTDKVLVLNPRRLVSLWDMIDYWAGSFLPIWKRLDEHLCCCRKANQSPYIGDGSREDMKRILEDLKPHLYAAELMQADGRLRHFYLLLESPITPAVLQSEIEGLQNAIEWELADRKFAFIPTGKAAYFENENLFEDLHQSLSVEINVEIKASGNCFAAELNSASAFHALRAAELGMRHLAVYLGLTFFRGKKKIQINVDDATWDELITETKNKIESEKALPLNNRTIKDNFKEYERLANQFDRMKNDRNNTMHTRGNFSEADARAILLRVKDFLKELVKIGIPLK